MAHKITHADKSKIYRPKSPLPIFSTNVITNNKTTSDGNVENISELNAIAARDWVNENHK